MASGAGIRPRRGRARARPARRLLARSAGLALLLWGASAPAAAAEPEEPRAAANGAATRLENLPALGERALCAEVARSAAQREEERARLEKAREALARERTELEALAGALEQARAALRAEADRLERLLGLADKATAPGGDKYWEARAAELARDPDAAAAALGGLARALKGMRPAAAAQLTASLNPALAAAVLARMRPADASAILEQLEPRQAAALFQRMAQAPSAGPAKEAPR